MLKFKKASGFKVRPTKVAKNMILFLTKVALNNYKFYMAFYLVISNRSEFHK